MSKIRGNYAIYMSFGHEILIFKMIQKQAPLIDESAESGHESFSFVLLLIITKHYLEIKSKLRHHKPIMHHKQEDKKINIRNIFI